MPVIWKLDVLIHFVSIICLTRVFIAQKHRKWSLLLVQWKSIKNYLWGKKTFLWHASLSKLYMLEKLFMVCFFFKSSNKLGKCKKWAQSQLRICHKYWLQWSFIVPDTRVIFVGKPLVYSSVNNWKNSVKSWKVKTKCGHLFLVWILTCACLVHWGLGFFIFTNKNSME